MSWVCLKQYQCATKGLRQVKLQQPQSLLSDDSTSQKPTWHLRRKMWNFTDREAVWVTLMQIHHPPNFDRRASGSDKREIHFLAGGVSFAKVWIRSVVVVWQAKVVQTSWDAGTWIYQPTRRRLCQQLECSVFQSLRTRFCEQST